MGIRKRGSVWWIDFTTPSGERVRRSAETEDKSQAQELHDKLKAEVWRVTKLGDRPRRTWNDAVVRWLTEQSHKASLESDKIHLRWLDKHLNGLDLTAITRERLDRIAAAKQSEGVTPATVNRVMEVLRAILKKCADDWEWIDRAPKVRMLNRYAVLGICCARRRSDCSAIYRFTWQIWRLSRYRQVCDAPMSQAFDGIRWTWRTGALGCILTRPKPARRSQCR